VPLIFSYGTLQYERVQLSTFGRLLRGERDELVGFETTRVTAKDGKTQNANVTFNGRDESRVRGTVFEITDAELAAADQYEARDEYARISTTLGSGRQAWVYVFCQP